MDKFSSWTPFALAALLGMLLGAVLYAWWLHRQALAKRRIPRQSPIVKRALVNSRERSVWRWLVKTFSDHHVMIKIPVTRFTLPTAEADREQWFAVLADVYCTFTVVNSDGKVVGCVDVAGPSGLPQANLQIKRRLFSRCNIPHWVVQPEQLPRDQDVYSSFVSGAQEAETAHLEPTLSSSQLAKAKVELQAAVSRRRSGKEGHDENGFGDSILGTDWAPDSFKAPLDSRSGDLP